MDQLHLYFDKTVLSWLIGVPFLGTFALLFTPRQSVKTIRALSVGVMVLEFLISLHLLTGDYTSGTYQYVASYDLVPAYGISYTVGIDGHLALARAAHHLHGRRSRCLRPGRA